MIVITDGSFAALIKLVIMLMVLPLLQRVRVVGQAREHITIQLPAVKHLQHSVKTTSPQHPAPLLTTTRPLSQSTSMSSSSTSTSMSGMVTR